MRNTFVEMTAGAILLLGLASCSSDDPIAGDQEPGMEMADEHADFEFGEPAAASEADRVIDVVARDDFSFTPARMDIAAGEVVTFRVTNEGRVAHDFTLGDADTQDEHDAEMAGMAGMGMADEPNGFGIAAGETKELTWRFTEVGDLLIGCHIPGHYGAGMRADISVTS